MAASTKPLNINAVRRDTAHLHEEKGGHLLQRMVDINESGSRRPTNAKIVDPLLTMVSWVDEPVNQKLTNASRQRLSPVFFLVVRSCTPYSYDHTMTKLAIERAVVTLHNPWRRR